MVCMGCRLAATGGLMRLRDLPAWAQLVFWLEIAAIALWAVLR